MTLNWFSPLPPARTGIAQYTADIAGTLCKHVRLRLWTDRPDWDRGLERYAEVRQYRLDQMPWAELNQAGLNIYHIGNNTDFHSSIWQISRQQPGVVVLHDVCLQHFFAGFYLAHQDQKGYMQQMSALYADEGRRMAEAFLRTNCDLETMAIEFPLTELAVQNALGVVVHSRAPFDRLARARICPVSCLSLPYAAAPEAKFREWKAAKPPTKPPYRLIVFGHLDANRRLDALLEALGTLPQKDRFRLDIFGSVWDTTHVSAKARACGLEQSVQLRGFTEHLDDELARADLAINLRYPSMGEASLSQLQIWDHALPSIVTKTAWYESLPPSAVAFVRPESEIADIVAHLQAFLRDPEHFIRMGEEGRRVLEEQHRPELYVRGLLDLVAVAKRFYSAGAALSLADRVGEDMSLWLCPDRGNAFAEKVGADIYGIFGGGCAGRLEHETA